MTSKKPYVIINHNKALLLHRSKTTMSNGSIMEIVIWQLPNATISRPHGFKYRLNYSLPDGSLLVRYDNRIPKGDHKHVKDLLIPYVFKTIEHLISDFFDDITQNGGSLD